MEKNMKKIILFTICLAVGGVLYWQYGYVEPLQKAQYYTRIELYQLAENIYSKMIQTSEVSRLRANNKSLLLYYNSEAGIAERILKNEKQEMERLRQERIASESAYIVYVFFPLFFVCDVYRKNYE